MPFRNMETSIGKKVYVLSSSDKKNLILQYYEWIDLLNDIEFIGFTYVIYILLTITPSQKHEEAI